MQQSTSNVSVRFLEEKKLNTNKNRMGNKMNNLKSWVEAEKGASSMDFFSGLAFLRL
jgi:hypothetical protein